jgi:hypothetical protein
MPMILLGGVLIGPISMVVLALVAQWRGADTHTIWYGDPLIGMGGFAALFFALIVGSVTTFLYILGLKLTHRRWTRSRDCS